MAKLRGLCQLTYINYGSGSYTGFCRIDDPDIQALKQPSVLGYIVAGILAGPHITLTPTVIDSGNIQTWADIGVVFLLFALGLEFSFKKLMKVGGPAIIAALTIIVGMVVLGFIVGVAMGWKQMDSIFWEVCWPCRRLRLSIRLSRIWGCGHNVLRGWCSEF